MTYKGLVSPDHSSTFHSYFLSLATQQKMSNNRCIKQNMQPGERLLSDIRLHASWIDKCVNEHYKVLFYISRQRALKGGDVCFSGSAGCSQLSHVKCVNRAIPC